MLTFPDFLSSLQFSINIMGFNMLLRNITTFNSPSDVQFVYGDFQYCEYFWDILGFITPDPYNVSQINLFSFINFLKGLPIWKDTWQ